MDPLTIASLAPIVLNLGKSLFGKSPQKEAMELAERRSKRIKRVGGAVSRQNQAILKQNYAGRSQAGQREVLGRDLSRTTGDIFDALGDADREALAMLLRSKMQQDVFKAQRERDTLEILNKMLQELGALKEGGVSKEGGMDFQQLIGLLSQNPTKLEPKLDYQSQPTTDIPLRLK